MCSQAVLDCHTSLKFCIANCANLYDTDGHLLRIIAQADVATRPGAPEKTAEVVEEISAPR